MTLPRHLLCLALVLFASSCTQRISSDEPAADEQAAAAGDVGAAEAEAADAQPDWTAEYDEMAAAVELSDEEDAALKEAFLTREEVVGGWLTSKGVRLRELEQELKSAARARDLRAIQRIKTEATPLRTELRDLIETHQADIRAALTPDNQLVWAAHELAERVLKIMEPLKLTAEQAALVREASITSAQAKADEPNPSAAGYMHLERSVEESVLTPEQRGRFEPIKKKKAMRSLY